jgi:hypothetical protein
MNIDKGSVFQSQIYFKWSNDYAKALNPLCQQLNIALAGLQLSDEHKLK